MFKKVSDVFKVVKLTGLKKDTLESIQQEIDTVKEKLQSLEQKRVDLTTSMTEQMQEFEKAAARNEKVNSYLKEELTKTKEGLKEALKNNDFKTYDELFAKYSELFKKKDLALSEEESA